MDLIPDSVIQKCQTFISCSAGISCKVYKANSAKLSSKLSAIPGKALNLDVDLTVSLLA